MKNKTLPTTLADFRPNEKNPRTISPARLVALRDSLDAFGDLGAIVLNRRTGKTVGGHQRLKAWADCPADQVVIQTTETLPKPDAQGTVARGFVILAGAKYSLRVVDWPVAKERAAMIAANKHGGEWDEGGLRDLLAQLEADAPELAALSGFDVDELAAMLKALEIPGANKAIDEAALAETNCECPKCHFRWQK